ncbi:MAG: hypothetical protein NZM09_08755 [Ignavibacterium sp.]|nr:hypothetical protein [Ignavibacterium sp.]MDW8375773.1 hypothetical protein [Ignavibacteriales bacterium]
MKKIILISAFIPIPTIAAFVWMFGKSKNQDLLTLSRMVINFQLNFLFLILLSVLLIPYLIGVLLFIAVIFFEIKYVARSLKENSINRIKLPYYFKFI